MKLCLKLILALVGVAAEAIAQRLLQSHSTLPAAITVRAEVIAPQKEAIAPVERAPLEHVTPPISRRELVEALLDEAHAQGIKTYADLIGYVAAQSGTPCGRRTVANWKRRRQVADAA